MSFVPADDTVYCKQPSPQVGDLPTLECGMQEYKIQTNILPFLSNGDYIESREFSIVDICGEEHTKVQTIYHKMTSNNWLFGGVTGWTGPYTYYWEILNGSCHLITGQGTPRIKISVSYLTLKVKLTVIDANGCKTECYYTADCEILPNSLPDDQSNFADGNLDLRGQALDLVTLRPNPTSGTTFVEYDFSEAADLQITLLDNMGKPVATFNRHFDKGIGNVQIPSEDLKSGVYFVNIIGNNYRKTLKLVKIN